MVVLSHTTLRFQFFCYLRKSKLTLHNESSKSILADIGGYNIMRLYDPKKLNIYFEYVVSVKTVWSKLCWCSSVRSFLQPTREYPTPFIIIREESLRESRTEWGSLKRESHPRGTSHCLRKKCNRNRRRRAYDLIQFGCVLTEALWFWLMERSRKQREHTHWRQNSGENVKNCLLGWLQKSTDGKGGGSRHMLPRLTNLPEIPLFLNSTRHSRLSQTLQLSLSPDAISGRNGQDMLRRGMGPVLIHMQENAAQPVRLFKLAQQKIPLTRGNKIEGACLKHGEISLPVIWSSSHEFKLRTWDESPIKQVSSKHTNHKIETAALLWLQERRLLILLTQSEELIWTWLLRTMRGHFVLYIYLWLFPFIFLLDRWHSLFRCWTLVIRIIPFSIWTRCVPLP